jgi:hypothetical protein
MAEMSGYAGKNVSSPRDTVGDLVRAKRSGRPISHRTSEGTS